MDLQTIAKQLDEAYLEAKPLERFTASVPGFSLQSGYQVQESLLHFHELRGEKIIGRKMGMTSRAKMQQMGIASPIHGFLTSAMQVTDGGEFSLQGRIHPKVEPEIAFLTSRELRGNLSAAECLQAVELVLPALEIIDSRYQNFSFQLPDVVADNCSAAAFVLGSSGRSPSSIQMENLGILLEVNHSPVQFGSSAAILGNPLRSLVELVRLLNEEGKSLPAGSIVLAGGATAAVPLGKGDHVKVSVQDLGSAEFFVS